MAGSAVDCYCEGDWICHHHAPVETRIAVRIAQRDVAARLAAAEQRADAYAALYVNMLRQSIQLLRENTLLRDQLALERA